MNASRQHQAPSGATYPTAVQFRSLMEGRFENVRWATGISPEGHFAGYVRLPDNHPWERLSENAISGFTEREISFKSVSSDGSTWIGFSSFYDFQPDPQRATVTCAFVNVGKPVYREEMANGDTFLLCKAVADARVSAELLPYEAQTRHSEFERTDVAMSIWEEMVERFRIDSDPNGRPGQPRFWATTVRYVHGAGECRDLANVMAPTFLTVYDLLIERDIGADKASFDWNIVPLILFEMKAYADQRFPAS